jgi:hypothetical protein
MKLIRSGKSSLGYPLHGAYCIPKRTYTVFYRNWQVNLAGIGKNTFIGMLMAERMIASQGAHYDHAGILSQLQHYYLYMNSRFLSFFV